VRDFKPKDFQHATKAELGAALALALSLLESYVEDDVREAEPVHSFLKDPIKDAAEVWATR
jgi:hypothetical protein